MPVKGGALFRRVIDVFVACCRANSLSFGARMNVGGDKELSDLLDFSAVSTT